MKTKSRLSGKLQLAFGSAILALLAVGAISHRGMFFYGPTFSRFYSTEGVKRARSMEVFQ
jgi:hypothetical protein